MRWTRLVFDSNRVAPVLRPGWRGCAPTDLGRLGPATPLGRAYGRRHPGLMEIPRSGISIRCKGWTPTHRRRTRGGLIALGGLRSCERNPRLMRYALHECRKEKF